MENSMENQMNTVQPLTFYPTQNDVVSKLFYEMCRNKSIQVNTQYEFQFFI